MPEDEVDDVDESEGDIEDEDEDDFEDEDEGGDADGDEGEDADEDEDEDEGASLASIKLLLILVWACSFLLSARFGLLLLLLCFFNLLGSSAIYHTIGCKQPCMRVHALTESHESMIGSA